MLFLTAIKTLKFPNWKTFLNWKEEEEASSHTFYVQPNGVISSGQSTDSNEQVFLLLAITDCYLY